MFCGACRSLCWGPYCSQCGAPAREPRRTPPRPDGPSRLRNGILLGLAIFVLVLATAGAAVLIRYLASSSAIGSLDPAAQRDDASTAVPIPEGPCTQDFVGTTLRRGEASRFARAVAGVQAFLQTERRRGAVPLDGGRIDGVFDRRLQRAVYTYQQVRGLDVTGVVDERTWDDMRSRCRE